MCVGVRASLRRQQANTTPPHSMIAHSRHPTTEQKQAKTDQRTDSPFHNNSTQQKQTDRPRDEALLRVVPLHDAGDVLVRVPGLAMSMSMSMRQCSNACGD